MEKVSVEKLIEELKEETFLPIAEDDYDSPLSSYTTYIWNDIKPYFPELKNIVEVIFDDVQWIEDDIFSDLAKLENLKCLHFISTDLSKIESYIYEGLEKIPKLETLSLGGTNLKHLPYPIIASKSTWKLVGSKYSIYDDTIEPNIPPLPNLNSVGLLGNNFYKQNFHFKLEKDITDIYEKIKYYLDKKCDAILENLTLSEEAKNLEYSLYDFTKHQWGLECYSSKILILKDYYLNFEKSEESLSVYVLNENKEDGYVVFKRWYSLFKELNETEKCFKQNSHGELDVFFFFENDHNAEINFNQLKQLQKTGEIRYEKYFISDLLIYLGNEQLILDINNEQIEADKEISKDFFDNNNLIKSIGIENFKLFEKEELKDLDNINIIVGKNGNGKTSLLQAIAISLIPHNSRDIDNLPGFINVTLKNKPESLQFARTHSKWEKFEKAQRIYKNKIEIELINKTEFDLPQSYLVLAYGENIYSREHAFKDEKQDYQDILASGNYRSYHTKAIFTTSYEYMINPLDLLYELSDGQIKQDYQALKVELSEIADIIRNKLNSFLEKSTSINFRIEKNGAYYKFFDTDKNQFLDFEQISEGYRSYIILLADIIFRILAARKRLLVYNFTTKQIFENVKGAIIIDEFDKHMHPSWQRTFLKTLREEFPKIQFFLSTHNLFSLQSAEGFMAFILETNEKKTSITGKKIERGLSIDSIFNMYFGGNNNFFGYETEQLFDQFYALLKKVKLLKATNNEIGEFKNVADKLLKRDEEVQVIISRELKQMERQTGKAFEL